MNVIFVFIHISFCNHKHNYGVHYIKLNPELN